MTTGNVPSAPVITVSVITQGSTASREQTQTPEFQKFLNEIMSQDTFSSGSTSGTYVRKNRTREELASPDAGEDAVRAEDVEKLADDIRNVIKDTLDITDEELEEVMAELGITVQDLLQPHNITDIVAEVKGVSAVEIITDEGFGGLVSDITEGISNVITDFAADYNLDFEQIEDSLVQIEDDGMRSIPEEVLRTAAADSENADTVEVTVEDRRVSENNAATEEEGYSADVHEKNTVSEKVNDENGRYDPEDDEDTDTDLAGEVIRNLSDALEKTTESFSRIAETNEVDGADVIRQVLDAIKVTLDGDSQSIEIQLTPEHLGKMKLEVVSGENGLTATITTQNEAAKGVIESQLIQLKEQLNSQGLKIQDVEVTVSPHGFDANADNGGRNTDGDGTRPGRRFRSIDELPADEKSFADSIDIVDSNINLMA